MELMESLMVKRVRTVWFGEKLGFTAIVDLPGLTMIVRTRKSSSRAPFAVLQQQYQTLARSQSLFTKAGNNKWRCRRYGELS